MKHIRHEFEPMVYIMWLSTNLLLTGLMFVAVEHL